MTTKSSNRTSLSLISQMTRTTERHLKKVIYYPIPRVHLKKSAVCAIHKREEPLSDQEGRKRWNLM